MKKAVFSVMFISVIAKLLGFIRELVLAYCVGANGISDAYLISLTIPGTIFQFVGTGLMTCYVPIFLRTVDEDGKVSGNKYTNSVLTMILIFSTIMIIMVCLFCNPIVKVFASGFAGDTLKYAVLFTKINIFSLYFSAFIYVFNALLQSCGKFEVTAAAAIPNSIIILVSIVLGAKCNILLLPIGSIFAVLAQLCFLIPSVKRCDFKLQLNMEFKSSSMTAMYNLLFPVIIGVSVNEMNVLVDRTIASQVSEGGISSLTYAYSLVMFVQGIFGQTIAMIYYPSITKCTEKNSDKDLKEVIDEGVRGMLFFLIPIMVGSIVLSRTIVHILYGRGAFTDESVQQTAQAFTGYAVGIIGFGIREIISRVFYSLKNTKIPTRNAIIGMLINIILNLTLSKWLGIRGLALATSISSIISAFLLLKDAKRMGVYYIDEKLVSAIFKMICFAMIMGASIILISNKIIVQTSMLNLVILILTGVCVYVGLMYFSRIMKR